MYRVVKRDNSVAEFDIKKISEAIIKAFEATEKQYNNSVIDLLALKVTADFEPKIKDGLIAVEDIQDSVEEVLSQAGYADVAKAYILYRKQREKLRNMKSTILDYKETVNNYVNVTDWRVKENSTVTYSVGGLILSNSGAITANYWLSEVYDEEIANAHRNADIHIHDLSMLTGYCAGWSLRQLIKEGLGGVTGKITSKPAKHLASLCKFFIQYVYCVPSSPALPLQPDGELPWHNAERVGGSTGLLLLRHLPCPLRKGGQYALRRGEKVHRVLYLRREHPKPLGHSGSLQQHNPRLDCTRRPCGAVRHSRRRGNALQV